jgi:hypothetical protein
LTVTEPAAIEVVGGVSHDQKARSPALTSPRANSRNEVGTGTSASAQGPGRLLNEQPQKPLSWVRVQPVVLLEVSMAMW